MWGNGEGEGDSVSSPSELYAEDMGRHFTCRVSLADAHFSKCRHVFTSPRLFVGLLHRTGPIMNADVRVCFTGFLQLSAAHSDAHVPDPDRTHPAQAQCCTSAQVPSGINALSRASPRSLATSAQVPPRRSARIRSPRVSTIDEIPQGMTHMARWRARCCRGRRRYEALCTLVVRQQAHASSSSAHKDLSFSISMAMPSVHKTRVCII